MDKIKLFCFPYAGGMAGTYCKWRKYLDKSIELCPIEFAGRGKRITTPFYNSVSEAVNDIYNIIEKDIIKYSYAFFGHSMGSLIQLELAYKLRELGYQEPLHVFFSGRKAPSIEGRDEVSYNLSNKDFIEKILKYKGTPKEVFENSELLNVFLPILRADFRIIEQYLYIERNYKLNCNITVLYGEDDEEVNESEAAGWVNHTLGDFNIITFDGGHFYLNDHTEKVVGIINDSLLQQSVTGLLHRNQAIR